MFDLTPKQQKQIASFIKKQNKIHRELEKKGVLNLGASGAPYTYHFTPTGIGVVVKIEDTLTLTELDVTDYSSW